MATPVRTSGPPVIATKATSVPKTLVKTEPVVPTVMPPPATSFTPVKSPDQKKTKVGPAAPKVPEVAPAVEHPVPKRNLSQALHDAAEPTRSSDVPMVGATTNINNDAVSWLNNIHQTMY